MTFESILFYLVILVIVALIGFCIGFLKLIINILRGD